MAKPLQNCPSKRAWHLFGPLRFDDRLTSDQTKDEQDDSEEGEWRGGIGREQRAIDSVSQIGWQWGGRCRRDSVKGRSKPEEGCDKAQDREQQRN